MKTLAAVLTIAAVLAALRATLAPVVTPPALTDAPPAASSTATVAVPPDDTPCPITYIDPWGRWHCGAAGLVPPAVDLEANPYPGPCVTVGMWQGRAVCDDADQQGYPAP